MILMKLQLEKTSKNTWRTNNIFMKIYSFFIWNLGLILFFKNLI